MKAKNRIIIILIILNIIVYSCDIFLYCFYEPNTKIIENNNNNKPSKIKENVFIDENFFKGKEYRIKGIGYYQETIGNLIFYKSMYNDNLIRIIIGEEDELTNLTYQSVLSTIKFMYPNEYEDFKNKFPYLQNLGFKRYQVTLYPTLDVIESHYLQSYDDYQFVLIEILKEF